MAATATSVEPSTGTATQRHSGKDQTGVEPRTGTVKTSQKKYRHVVVVHSQVRSSCLSHDSDAAPSFIGFRNLMVIVLGKRRRLVRRCRLAECDWQSSATCD